MLVGLRLPAREFRLGAAHLPAGTGFILDHLPEKGNGRHACGPATAILQAGLYCAYVVVNDCAGDMIGRSKETKAREITTLNSRAPYGMERRKIKPESYPSSLR